ncbi:MAG: FtsX-like permease family protein [Bacteroidales bacterium]
MLPDIKAAFRNIFRNKVPSAISILGLGIGLGCIMTLIALIIHEKSFDRFFPGYKKVYRINFGQIAQTQFPLAENIAADFPEVKGFFRYYQTNTMQMKARWNEIVPAPDFGFADSSIFRILGIQFISGTCANSVSEVAISDISAMKYFGNLSPVGAVLPVRFPDGFIQLTVSGVYKSLPSNSTLSPAFIADIKLSERTFRQFTRILGAYGWGSAEVRQLGWADNEFLSYLVLENKADPDELRAKFAKYKEFIDIPNKDSLSFSLQPAAEIYLGSGEINGAYFQRRGNPEELKYYEIISLIILIISITNYVLLARAGVSERAQQLGTRKVYGASPGKIRKLILTESVIIVVLSLIPATFVIDYGMTFINAALNKTLTSQVFLSPLLWLLLIIIILLTGLLAGWVIGLNFSRVPALKLISGSLSGSGSSFRWNSSFLILHFTIYLILVSGMIAVSKQLRYTMTGYTGIDPGNVLVADLNSDELKKSFLTLCDEMKKMPGVVNVAGGSFIPPIGNYIPINLATTEGDRIRFDGLIMGEGMTELLGIQIVEGSSFGPYKTGTPEIVINESAAKKHNVKAGENLLVFKVRGVVKDFNAHSMHTLIEPMVILQQDPAKMGLLAIKTDGKNDEAITKKLRELYSAISPEEIFEVRYLNDEVTNFYERERNQYRVISAFSILAMVLSIMGLFGISLISIAKQKKQISIRKVNGATISEVLLMLNFDFLRWVMAAIIVSVPVSVWLISVWIRRFAYKTGISWWIFAVAGLSAVIIAVLTISWQSWRAATRNPVEVLRYE